jgi:hypothetical protein
MNTIRIHMTGDYEATVYAVARRLLAGGADPGDTAKSGGSRHGRRLYAMTPFVTMREFLTSPDYLGTAELMAGASWRLWRTLLMAIRGEKLEPDELLEYQELTGRTAAPTEPVREFMASLAVAAASRVLAPCWRRIWPRALTIVMFWRRVKLVSCV